MIEFRIGTTAGLAAACRVLGSATHSFFFDLRGSSSTRSTLTRFSIVQARVFEPEVVNAMVTAFEDTLRELKLTLRATFARLAVNPIRITLRLAADLTRPNLTKHTLTTTVIVV